MHKVYLLLGGNLGNVPLTFKSVTRALQEKAGQVVQSSRLYLSEPWGMKAPEDFLNQALEMQTRLSPQALMQVVLDIEKEFGRNRSQGVLASRTIDIDVLIYDQLILSLPGIEIPHPRLHLRRFALEPLAEIAPACLHPVLMKSIAALLEECIDPLWVKPFGKPTIRL